MPRPFRTLSWELMQKSQIDSITLVLAALAAALALAQISGPLVWLGSIGGLVLLFVLLSFDQEGYRNPFQSLAFSGACGLCTAVAAGAILQLMSNHGEVHLANGQWATEYMPIVCGFAIAIFWIIDLMRMNARKAAPIQVPRALGAVTEAPAPVYQARAAAAPPAPAPVSRPALVYQPPPEPVRQPIVPETIEAPPYRAPEPVRRPEPEPQPAPAPAQMATATRMFSYDPEPPVSAPVPDVEPLKPGPAPIVSQSGKEAMIYVSLLGEGLNVMRSVRAEPLGHDYYRIIEEMPQTETWQFQPGQVVRCKKKTLSTGKAMVAMEEAPRST